jgi:4-hydroxybenzoate polyprenyltransferase
MNRWLKYYTERFPIVNLATLVAGISLSGIFISEKPFHILPFILSFIGIVFVLALMRLMDDVKNLEKDRTAHSNRPLPKGLISKKEAILVIDTMTMILFVFGLLLWVLLSASAALSYIVIIAYFWLVYKDFNMRLWLSKNPIIYGFLRNVTIILIAIFAVEVMNPPALLSSSIWSFAIMLFGAFFCFDILCKLNPYDHPALATYIHFYGFRTIFIVAAVALAVSAMGAIHLGLGYILIPMQLIVMAALSVLFFQKELYKLPQIMGSLSLMLHAWAIVIQQAVT